MAGRFVNGSVSTVKWGAHGCLCTDCVCKFTQLSEYLHVVDKPEMHERARTLYAHDNPATNFWGYAFELMQVSLESYCGQVDISRGVLTSSTEERTPFLTVHKRMLMVELLLFSVS